MAEASQVVQGDVGEVRKSLRLWQSSSLADLGVGALFLYLGVRLMLMLDRVPAGMPADVADIFRTVRNAVLVVGALKGADAIYSLLACSRARSALERLAAAHTGVAGDGVSRRR
jgi:hypothetical protein